MPIYKRMGGARIRRRAGLFRKSLQGLGLLH